MNATRTLLNVIGIATVSIAATTALTMAPAYAATTYTVDNTSSSCSDTGPGTATQPFCTIGTAAAKAHAGDTVVVRAGTYTGTSVNPANSGTASSPIKFTANPGVTISGGTRAFALSSRSNITVSGFAVTGTSSYGISVSGGGNVVISGNKISFAGHPVSGQTASGIYLSSLAGGLISGNITHDNSAHGIYLSGSTTGVTVQGNTSYHNAYQYQRNANGINVVAPGNTILGNVTYANEDSGINIYPGANNSVVAGNVTYDNGDHGIDDLNVTGGRITGNTVFFNCTTGINVEGTSGSYVIENNVSENNATGAVINPTPINPTGAYTNNCNRRTGNIGVWDSAPATTTADYNLVWQTGAGAEYVWGGTSYSTQAALKAATRQEVHGSFANPRFANASAWNFQLTAGSPAIDSADSAATGEQANDVVGHPRVDDPSTPNTGSGPRRYDDRGAYEYQP
jgi:parallel beta-helix repeat protein